MVTVRNGHGNGERSGTLNGQERLGTFESLRSNALERIVENVHGTFTVRSRNVHGTFTERSRYVHVHVSKTKEALYIKCPYLVKNSGKKIWSIWAKFGKSGHTPEKVSQPRGLRLQI
jgi:hypothetical protein